MRWIVPLIGVLLFLLSFWVYHVLVTNERKSISYDLELVLQRAQIEITSNLESYVDELNHLTKILETQEELSKPLAVNYAKTYLDPIIGYEALAFISMNQGVDWEVSQANGKIKNILGNTMDYVALDNESKKIEKSKYYVMADPEGKGILILVPFMKKEQFLGWIIGFLTNQQLFHEVFRTGPVLKYAIQILPDHKPHIPIYKVNADDDKYRNKYLKTGEIVYGTVGWNLEVWPREFAIDMQHSAAPILVLFLGCLLSAMWFFVSLSHMSEKKQLEEDLSKAKKATNDAVRLKNEFLSVMNHEIRTPLTAVLGYCELLLSPSTSPHDRKDYTLIIQKNGKLLLSILSDVLDFMSIEANTITISHVECSPRMILEEICELLRPQAEKKNLTLNIDYRGSIPLKITTDPKRLSQILRNLIQNSIKFTEKGGVNVVVRLLDMNTPNALIQFEVIDTGIGISQEYLSKLFSPFTQVDSSSTRQFGGTGLGLIISRKLANLLGGGITCSSKPGAGSIFTLTVSASPISLEAALVETKVPLGAKPQELHLKGRVLLVEDAEDTQMLVKYYLTSAGFEVETANNGLEACQKATQAMSENKPFDLILMDIQMPIMDGYDATVRLRKTGYTGSIIALTAYATKDEENKCIQAGCDAVAAKPIDRDLLIKMLQQYILKK